MGIMNARTEFGGRATAKTSSAGSVIRPATCCTVWSALLAACASGQAQSVLVPPVEVSDRTPSMEAAAANQVGSVGVPILRRPSEAEAYPLRWGPLQIHPHLSYQLMYGDGILQGPSAAEKTAVQSIAPGMYFDVGRHWAVDGAVTFNEYSNPVFKDNVGYTLAVKGIVPREDWVVNFGYTSSLTEETQVETGTQDKQNLHLLGASATHQFHNRLSLELGVSQDIRLSKEQSDYVTWSSINWLNYQATAKTSVGLGGGGGYNLVDPGTDWFFEQIRGRVLWQPGKKLNVQVSGGGQFVQFQRTEVSPEVFPLVDASVSWQIFTSTILAASFNHAIENSLQVDQFVERTGVGVSLRQRFFEHFYLDIRPAFTRAVYDSSVAGATTGREDDYVSVQVQLSAVLFKKLRSSVFYQFADNDSSADVFTFQSNQVGLRLDYRY